MLSQESRVEALVAGQCPRKAVEKQVQSLNSTATTMQMVGTVRKGTEEACGKSQQRLRPTAI